MIKAEDIEITDGIDDPLINGIYIHLGDGCTLEEKIRLKQQILDWKEIVKRLKDTIQNIKDQIEVAEREDYADIDDYCMKLRLEELESILGEKK